MDDSHIKPVFERFIAGTQSEGDLRALTDYAADPEGNGHLSRLMDAYFAGAPADQTPEVQERLAYILANTDRFIREAVPEKIKGASEPDSSADFTAGKSWQATAIDHVPVVFRWRARVARALIAAVILSVLSIGYYYWRGINDRDAPLTAEMIGPGGNRATLKLGNGMTINLDEAQPGIVTGADNITYADGNTPVVILSDSEGSAKPQNLSLSTPKAGTYQVTLPDGSKVWLNASTTLKYPNKFPEKERVVQVEGEAFFEITQKSEQPFRITTPTQEISVLGTSINISDYAEDQLKKTTVATGRIKVTNKESQESVVLNPDQQSGISGGFMKVSEVNASDVIAWKDGNYIFTNTSLRSVITQMARWYDLEITPTQFPEVEFVGVLSRDIQLDEVLAVLERQTGLKFNLTGRRLEIRK